MSCYSQEPQKCSWQFGYKKMPSRSLLYLLASFMWIQETLCLLQIPPRWKRNSNCKGWHLPTQHSYLTYTLVQKTHRHTLKPPLIDEDIWTLCQMFYWQTPQTDDWELDIQKKKEIGSFQFLEFDGHINCEIQRYLLKERIIDTCFQHCQSPPRNPQQHPNYK